MSPEPSVMVDRVSAVRRDLTLNRGATRNALSSVLVDVLIDELRLAEVDGVRLVVLRSCVSVFSGGFDLTSLEQENDASLLLRFARIGLLFEQITHASYFTAAVMEGAAVGAGADLALACDHRFGTTDTSFRFPGAGFGVILGTQRLAALIGESEALQLATTNSTLGSAEASRLGILQTASNKSDAEAGVTELQERLERLPAKTAADLAFAVRGADDGKPLADLVRSIAGRPGIKNRIAAFAESTKSGRKSAGTSPMSLVDE